MQRQASVVIFGGTSEGRELAEYAETHQVPVLVSVVSGYGESLLRESDLVQVHTGALDETAMRQFLQEAAPNLVLDATHPYARVVTEQVAALCRELEISYQRVLRGSEQTVSVENRDNTPKTAPVYVVDSLHDAVECLKQDDRPVLLTTGSKELEAFAENQGLRERIYARVLPDSQVLKKCEDLGIHGVHVIAMQGPFSVELNCALLRTVQAGWLVTKEAGKRGGFVEKMEAARQCGASVVVIRRPVREEGISLEEAKRQMDAFGMHPAAADKMPDPVRNPGSDLVSGLVHDPADPNAPENRNDESNVPEKQKPDPEQTRRSSRTLGMIGMGMGGGRQLTLEALEVLEHGDIVFGASRMLADLAPWIHGKHQEAYYQPEKILDWMETHPMYQHAVVVCSGDTGFYSGSGSMLRELKKRWGAMESVPYEVKVYPGISSVSSLAARFGISWDDACLASAHGRDCDVAALLRQRKKIFLLLDSSMNLKQVCRILKDAGMGDTMIYAGVRMGYEDERKLYGTAEEMTGIETNSLAAIFLERKNDER